MLFLLLLSLGFSNLAIANPLPEKIYPNLILKNGLQRTLQSYCYEDEKGTLYGENFDLKIIPASVTKVYTTYVALKSFGPDFRFVTRFQLFKNDAGIQLHILGDHDGYFQNDHLFYVLNLIQTSGISEIKEITFEPNFYLNFNLDPSLVRLDLLKVFKTGSWTADLKSAYSAFVIKAKRLGLQVSELPPKMNLLQAKVGTAGPLQPFAEFTIPSLRLLDLLKDMNVHSTNRFAKSLFVKFNNPVRFNEILYQDLGADESNMKFHDGSGGQSNYTTCRNTVRLFKALETLLSGYALRLDQIISVAGMDGGTLGKRFNEPLQSGSVLGKTGTLPDIGVSTLAGKISTQNGMIYYGIFNRYPVPNLSRAKNLQNELVEELLAAHAGKKEIEHQPWSFNVLEGLPLSSF